MTAATSIGTAMSNHCDANPPTKGSGGSDESNDHTGDKAHINGGGDTGAEWLLESDDAPVSDGRRAAHGDKCNDGHNRQDGALEC